MYAIIYWKSDDQVFARTNPNGTLELFETLMEADIVANELDIGTGYEARVITLWGRIKI